MENCLDLYKLNTIVLSDCLPTEMIDALYLFAEPDGTLREALIQRAIELAPRVTHIAMCGGTGQGYVGFYSWADELVEKGVERDRLVAIPYGDHVNTYSESIHLTSFAMEKNWKQIVLTAPVHQQLRACMTMIRQLQLQKADVTLYNAPSTFFPWNQELIHYQGEVKDVAHHSRDQSDNGKRQDHP